MAGNQENTVLIDFISIASSKFNVDKHSITSLKITVESCEIDLERLASYHFNIGWENRENKE